MATESIMVMAKSDVVTSKAGRKYFTVTDAQERKWLCMNPALHYQFELGKELTVEYNPARDERSSPAITKILTGETIPPPSPEASPPERKPSTRTQDTNESIEAQTCLKCACEIAKESDSIETILSYAQKMREWISK